VLRLLAILCCAVALSRQRCEAAGAAGAVRC
jgi:hypothetical protein